MLSVRTQGWSRGGRITGFYTRVVTIKAVARTCDGRRGRAKGEVKL